MKKVLVFAVAILTAATIFAQEKKAVIGVAKLTTPLSKATVVGHWGEYWGMPGAKDDRACTTVRTDYNTELKYKAETPASLPQVMQSLQNMLYDLFADSDLFEKVVECNESGSDAKDIDYLVQSDLFMLHLERDIFPFIGPNSFMVDNHAVLGVIVNLKNVKTNKKYTPMIFYAGWSDYKEIRERLREEKADGAFLDGTRYIRNRELTQGEQTSSSSGGLLSQAMKAAINKNKTEKPKDDFLYEDVNQGLKRLSKNIVIHVYQKINPPTVEAVDENGIITFSALGFNEKDMLDVKNGGERVAEIYVYDVKDRIAYAKVDPADPEFSDAEIREGFFISPAEREWNWQQVNNAVRNIKKQVKNIKKVQKANAKAKK